METASPKSSLCDEDPETENDSTVSDEIKDIQSLVQVETDALFPLIHTDKAMFKKECFSILQMIPENIEELDISSNKGLSVVFKAISFVDLIYNYPEDKLNRYELEEYQREFARLLLESRTFDLIRSIVNNCWENADLLSDGSKIASCLFATLLGILVNFTDCSDAFAAAVSDSKCLEVCKEILETYLHRFIKQQLSEYANALVLDSVNIVYNVSMRGTNVDRLRNLDFIKVLEPYMKSHDEDIKLTSLIAIASLVTEEECVSIETNIRTVSLLLNIFESGLDKQDRRFNGWSCKECALAVTNLARNDANKRVLRTLQVMTILVDFIEIGDEDEQLEGVRAIWALVFDEKIKEDIVTNKEIGLFEALQKLRLTNNELLKDACYRCLWELRDASVVMEHKEAVKEIQRASVLPEENEIKESHIMISYQTQYRDILLRIKNELEKKKYKVWMDVDQMCGSTLEAMAEGIECASVVLMCFSRSYKASQYCQSEANYAYDQKKPIIPLKMEKGYSPDGWLGFLIAQKIYVNFSEPCDFKKNIKVLHKEIKEATEHLKKGTALVPGGEIETVQRASPVVNKQHDSDGVSRNLSLVREWTKAEVENWLKEYNLINNGLDKITGEEIFLLAKMHSDASDQLYICMKKDLKIKKLVVKSRLVWALHNITKNQSNR